MLEKSLLACSFKYCFIKGPDRNKIKCSIDARISKTNLWEKFSHPESYLEHSRTFTMVLFWEKFRKKAQLHMFDWVRHVPLTPTWRVLGYFSQRNFRWITYAVISGWNETRQSFFCIFELDNCFRKDDFYKFAS